MFWCKQFTTINALFYVIVYQSGESSVQTERKPGNDDQGGCFNRNHWYVTEHAKLQQSKVFLP